MARLEDAAAASRLSEAELGRLLGHLETVPPRVPPRLVARWIVDEPTGRPVCCWSLAR